MIQKRKKFIIQPSIKYVCFDASDEEQQGKDKRMKGAKKEKENSQRTACCRTSEQQKLEHKFINIENK